MAALRRARQPLAPISLEQTGSSSHVHAGTEPVARSSTSSSSPGISDAAQRTLSPPRSPSKRPAASPLLLSATHHRTRVPRSARPEPQPSSAFSSPRSESISRSPQPAASWQTQSSSSPRRRRAEPTGGPGAQPQPDGASRDGASSARHAQVPQPPASLPRKAQRVSTWETHARETSPSPQRPAREQHLRPPVRESKIPPATTAQLDADWEVRTDTPEEIAAAALAPTSLTPDGTGDTQEDAGDENVDPWRPSAPCGANKTTGRKGTGGRLSLVLAAGADARQSASPSP